MNNSIKVQSPSFGMAHIIPDPARLAKAINNLSDEEMKLLSSEMKMAKEKLGNTRFADVSTYVDAESGKIIHECRVKEPRLNENGTIAFVIKKKYIPLKLKNAVLTAIEAEKMQEERYKILKTFDFFA